MRLAAKGGHRELVDLFITKGANEWDWAMDSAAQGGHRGVIVNLFLWKGAVQMELGPGVCSSRRASRARGLLYLQGRK